MYYLKRTEEGGIIMTERLQQFLNDKANLAFQDGVHAGEEQGVEKERRRIVTYLLQKGRTLDDALELIGMPSKD